MIDIHRIQKSELNIADIVLDSLPDQGRVEIQRDAPGKEHIWHKHNRDETLVMVSGNLRFYWGGGERVCYPGDVVTIKSGTPHGSEALHSGATYLLASHRVNL